MLRIALRVPQNVLIAGEVALVRRIVGEEPLTDMLELPASEPRVGVEVSEQVAECRHVGDVIRGGRLFAAAFAGD